MYEYFLGFGIILLLLYWFSKGFKSVEKSDLHNKHVLITGGSSGIGKSVAIEAAKLGAHVTIVARNSEKLELAVNEIKNVMNTSFQKLSPYNISVTLCLPPDTNTPGFENEEKSKPVITRLISKTAGLFEPDVVAKQLISDALNQRFFSVVGFESTILTTLCSGMSPVKPVIDGIFQILFMSLLKLVSVGYFFYFKKLILNHVKPFKPDPNEPTLNKNK
ncbi:short-chain dehydrogenase, putative [Pediculus humanus corporis]|uniref:Short-chain dehydrogenase, putative n=1 Tax=Pediculus humanus subsp. corporis TaxID=121224 RepID=E0VJJ8_PEDHC|nr:short-chain dehydrogenase, putative [Pediculus humanus corporis]EEB13554.1 short-chain dehydrogenase, putative [Pediculus humanus corporis]